MPGTEGVLQRRLPCITCPWPCKALDFQNYKHWTVILIYPPFFISSYFSHRRNTYIAMKEPMWFFRDLPSHVIKENGMSTAFLETVAVGRGCFWRQKALLNPIGWLNEPIISCKCYTLPITILITIPSNFTRDPSQNLNFFGYIIFWTVPCPRENIRVTIYCKNAYPGVVKHSAFVSTVEQIAKRQDWDSQTAHTKRHLHKNECINELVDKIKEENIILLNTIHFYVSIVKFRNYAKGNHYKVTCKIRNGG